MPELPPEQKLNPEVVTSGESDFESATGSLAHEPTSFINAIEGGPQVETEWIRTELVEYLEGGPQDDFEENPLVKSSYFTEPRPDQPYSPIKNLSLQSKHLTNPFLSKWSLWPKLPME
jgi:hypothetical protein